MHDNANVANAPDVNLARSSYGYMCAYRPMMNACMTDSRTLFSDVTMCLTSVHVL